MTSRTFTVSNAMNPDWVRADGLTAGAGTKTNCDSEPTEVLHFWALLKKDSMSVSDAREPDSMSISVGLTGSCSVDGMLGVTTRRR